MVNVLEMLWLWTKGAIALCLVFVAPKIRTPWFASTRTELLLALLTLGVGLIIIEGVRLRDNPSRGYKFGHSLVLGLASVAVAIALTQQMQFQLAKRSVLNWDVATLEQLGSHFIVGYRDLAEVRLLVEKKAIAGVFVTKRNVEGKTAVRVRQEISGLQKLRQEQGMPPLWIATDQEGGEVSQVSPPLTHLSSLGKTVAGKSPTEQIEAAIAYGSQQGIELAELGINLNLAPVVDLDTGLDEGSDRRAISREKDVVARIAFTYCKILEQTGVRCTLKHFPGLGRVREDTRMASATLTAPIAELAQEDWVPFRVGMKELDAFIMLGHARLAAIDPQYPVSFSETVVNDLIRQLWNFDGVLIADDFSMLSVFNSQVGLGGATQKAIASGVDLILLASDPDLYYPAMAALYEVRKDRIIQEQMERSARRLADNRDRLQLGF